MSNSIPISTKMLAKAAQGPHGHWGPRRMDAEGVRFHMLHKLVAEKHPDERTIRGLLKQLRAFAGYNAFAALDVHLRRYPHVRDERRQKEGVLAVATEQGYFDDIAKSLSILRMEASPAALRILREKGSMGRFLTAFGNGVEERQAFERRKAPAHVVLFDPVETRGFAMAA